MCGIVIECNVNCLIIVNSSPWGSGHALAAWRFAEAAPDNGMNVAAVFFREDGVYNAIAGAATDAGTPDLAKAWKSFSESRNVPLLLCRSSLDRRTASPPAPPFQASGLTVMFGHLLDCDRVVNFG